MNRGGHALMLRVEPPRVLTRFARSWAYRRIDRKVNTKGYHLTLVFLGRDKPDEVGSTMLGIAESMATHMPGEVTWTGDLRMFGFRYDHLVAVVDPTEELTAFRNLVFEECVMHGLKVDTRFNFNPHITLATGMNTFEDLPEAKEPMAMEVTGLEVKTGSGKVTVVR